MIYPEITSCRICNSKALSPVINLGNQLLASATVTKENEHSISKISVPLEVVRCSPDIDPHACGLVQLRHTYPSDLIYREYWYRSGINQTMKDALKNVVNSAKERVTLTHADLVLDIGCNDGTLLSNYETSLTRVGFDPVENIRGEDEDFQRIVDYFNAKSFKKNFPNQKVKILTSIAMFYDLEDPNQFVADIAEVLAPEGIWVVQMADLPEMIEKNMFDQIIHEHLEYYHIRPFEYLINKHGLKIVDMEKNNINGSSYRFYIKKITGSSISKTAEERIKQFKNEESKLNLDTDIPYKRFRDDVEKIRDELSQFIKIKKNEGKKIYAYGASTKGNVILQYCKITNKDIPFVADRNPLKYGARTIGSNITIISEDEARKQNPDYFLVLPYYFLNEMAQREKSYLLGGGQFVVPVPHLHFFDKSALKQ